MNLYTHADLDTLVFPEGITTVGVELEGYWKTATPLGITSDPEDCDMCYWDEEYGEWVRCEDCADDVDGYTIRRARRELGLKADGSVHVPRHLTLSHVAGEAASDILRTWPAVVDFVMSHYPDAGDHKCGMHVHLGCTRDQWAFAFDPIYWMHLQSTLAQTGTGCSPQTQAWLNRRLKDGRSTAEADVYCAPNRQGEHYGRYWAVNYNAFDAHGTLEVRVNPMAEGMAKGTYNPATQALNLIYTTLASTSTFWTTPSMWRQESQRATAAEDIRLESTIETAPDEHIRFTL